MAAITIITMLDSATPSLPELAPFVGKKVKIRVREASDLDDLDDLIGHEYYAVCAAEVAAYGEPIPSLEEAREMLSTIPGSLAADIIADREDR